MDDSMIYETREDASRSLASQLADTLRSAIEARGEASLVVSGGSSPLKMFRYLSKEELDWSRVTVLASDERVVPEDHPDRNEAMIRRELLRNHAAAATLCSLLPADELPAFFDAVVLGMGGDGHTASLFPDTPKIKKVLKSDRDLEQVDVPSKNMERITLTPKALLRSGRIDLLFFGRDKAEVFDWARQGKKTKAMPVRFVLKQDRVPVSVFWAP